MTEHQLQKKNLALQWLAPYFKNPRICAFDHTNGRQYICYDGRKSVLGSRLLPEINPKKYIHIDNLIKVRHGQENVLIPEAANIFTDFELFDMELIHFYIAIGNTYMIKEILENQLQLFTYDEMLQFVAKIPEQALNIEKNTNSSTVLNLDNNDNNFTHFLMNIMYWIIMIFVFWIISYVWRSV